jgi:hypothetical protein
LTRFRDAAAGRPQRDIFAASAGNPDRMVQKNLAFARTRDDIVAVRHDLPHMPSLGVSSLDLGRRGNTGGLLFSKQRLYSKQRLPVHSAAIGGRARPDATRRANA